MNKTYVKCCLINRNYFGLQHETRRLVPKQYKTSDLFFWVARQISWGTFKTAPSPNVNFGLCRSRSLVCQHFTAQAQTELAINLTEKMPKGKRSKVWLYFAQKDSNIATCSKCNKIIACKEGREGKSQRQISNCRLKTKRRCQQN